MIQKVTLPRLGETIESSIIERWRKKEGDAVAPGDILCEVSTDKAVLEVECPYAGTILRLVAPEKAPLTVGTLIAVVGQPGEAIPPAILAEAAEVAAAPVAPETAPLAPADSTVADVVPLNSMRRIIADRMMESKRTSPCYYLEMDVDVTDLVGLRNKLNAKAPATPGQPAPRRPDKISFNDFILRACGMALKAFPVVNSRWIEGRGIQRRSEIHIGFAVALDDGLLVPVVRNVDRKGLREISVETAALTDRARLRKLTPEEFGGGCMSITNLGIYGIRSFIPIVNPGESTILGLGIAQDRVVFRQGGIQVRKMMAVTLAVDHRLVDGAIGAQFLEMIKDLLEAPQRITE
jgi:pyruvate dehydrogenase E2 component (dihydrolipoamide acetyltransferase)